MIYASHGIYVFYRKNELWKECKTNLKKPIAHFFYKQHFLTIQPHCCLASSWTELKMLARCRLIHKTETNFIFSLFVSMPRPRSIFIVSMWCMFQFQPHFIIVNLEISLKQTHLFFAYFLEYLILSLDDNMDEKNE